MEAKLEADCCCCGRWYSAFTQLISCLYKSPLRRPNIIFHAPLQLTSSAHPDTLLTMVRSLVAFVAESLISASYVATTTLPPPQGPYGVAMSTAVVTNPAMLDPYAPSEEYRRIMISAFYPTSDNRSCEPYLAPYMPPATAQVYDDLYSPLGLPNGTFGSIDLSLCRAAGDSNEQKSKCGQNFPVVLLSPGLGNSRLLYNSISANLAAEGFIVLTLDHPYDATVIEFPDGTIISAANITTDEQITAALDVRTADMVYVAQSLHNATFTQTLFGGLYGASDLGRLFAYGHSLGGATAAAAMLQGRGIRGGINLDGTFFWDVVSQGLDRPFMIMSLEGKDLSTDQSWSETWSKLKSSKLLVSVEGTQHGSFLDFPLLLDVLGFREALDPALVEDLVGTIPGSRIIEVLSTSASAFLRFAGRKRTWDSMQEAMERSPEVMILNETLAKPERHLVWRA